MLNTDRTQQTDSSIQNDPSLDPSDPGNFGEDINDGFTYSDSPIVGSSAPSDYYGDTPTNVTREEISNLFFKLQSNKDSKADSDLLALLRDALQDLNQGNVDKANGEYQSALQGSSGDSPWNDPQLNGALQDAGLDGSPNSSEDPSNDSSDASADPSSPSTDENGVKHYQDTTGEGINLTANGDGSHNVIETQGNFVFTPVSPDDEISLFKNGDSIVIKSNHAGKTDYFQVNANATIHINSDRVSGNLDNKDGNITVGNGDNPTPFYSSGDRDSIGSAIENAAKKVIAPAYGNSDASIGDVDPAVEKKKAADVKKALKYLGSALQETDPDKQKNLFENATEIVKNWTTQSASAYDHGAALLVKVLYGELGHDGLKDAIRNNLIPKDFVSALSEGLTVTGSDGSDVSKNYQVDSYMENQHYHGTSSGWTIATAVSNLKDWAGITNSTDASTSDSSSPSTSS